MQVILGEIHPFPNARADEEQAAKILAKAAEVFCAWQHVDSLVYGYDPSMPQMREPLLNKCAGLIMECVNMVAGLGMALSTEVEPHYMALDERFVRELLVRTSEVQEAVYRYEYEDAMFCLYERRGETGGRLDELRRLVEHAANCVFAGCEEIVCRVAGLVLQLGVEDFSSYMQECEKRNRERGRHE